MNSGLLEQLSAGKLPRGGCWGRRRQNLIRRSAARRNRTKCNRLERVREVRYWVKEHMREIEEAREGGYSWRQIMRVTLNIWKEARIFSDVHVYKDESLLRHCYNAVKKSESDTEEFSDPLIEVQAQVLIRRGRIC